MRKLGDEEKALWLKVVQSITPLRKSSGQYKSQASGADHIKGEGWQKADVRPKKNILPLQNIKPNDIEQSFKDANPSRADLAAALSRPIKKTPIPMRRTFAFGINNNDSHKTAHNGLDGHWEKRFTKGVIIPDISIDLHGAGLQSAYDRLDGALQQARLQKLRVILLVTGRDRQYDRASGEGRGGIRAVMSDWLAASRHSEYIASVRNAHPRHGGAGALYIILRK